MKKLFPIFWIFPLLLVTACSSATESRGGNGEDNSNDCAASAIAGKYFADQLHIKHQAVIGINPVTMDTRQELAGQIQACLPEVDAETIQTVVDSSSVKIISMLASNTDENFSLQPIWAIIEKNNLSPEGNVPLVFVNANNDDLRVERDETGRVIVHLEEACLEGRGVKGCDGPAVDLAALDDELQTFEIGVLDKQSDGAGDNLFLTADALEDFHGGANILDIAQAQLEKEAALENFDQLSGVGVNVTEIAGSSGDVGGEAGPAFTPDAAFSQSLNEQGFWLVTETGRLNVAMDGLQVVNATDYIYDSEDPRQIYALEKADGQAVVHTENGVNFVYYGVIEDGVFVTQEKQIIALPDMGLPGVEAGTLIASDPLAIPEDLRAGLDLQPGTVLIGLTGRGADGSGQAFDLAPSVFKIGDTVLIFQNADGSLTITVSGEDGDRTYTLHVDPEALAPEVIDYGICTPEAFRECPVPPEDLFNGNYARWYAETLSRPFEVNQLDQRPWVMTSNGILIPDPTIKRTPGTVTAHLHETAGITTMDGLNYRLVPFELPDPGDPANPDKNIVVVGFEFMNYIKEGQIAKELPANLIDKHTGQLLGMRVPPLMTDFRYLSSSVEIPLAKRTWDALGAETMAEIFQRARNGDITALRELRGMPVMIDLGKTEWYK